MRIARSSGKKITARVVIVSDLGESLFSKLLAASSGKLGIEKIEELPSGRILDFLFDLAGTSMKSADNAGIRIIDFRGVSRFWSVGFFINSIIYRGFPIGLLGVLLAISLAVLVLSTIKQFI